jgi:hypothetical protein
MWYDNGIGGLDKYLPIEHCPACKLKLISDEYILHYLCAEYGKGRNDFRKEIQNQFGDWEKLLKYLDGKKVL